jgi:2-methylcitrate dehydratase PrpD
VTHLEKLGRWVAGVTWESLPEPTRRAARMQLLNMVAAAHASAAESAPLVAALGTFAAAGRATVVATGQKLGPADAALANAAFSMAQDFDDIVWMGHTCHSAVWAPLAVAEHERASTRDLVTAIVVANEIGGRIGASSFLGPLNGQMWTFIHLAGAAAATARLLGLDGERTMHALAIALAQPNFALQPGFMEPTSKLLAAATPTATGIQAGYFARAGMTGAPALLEDGRGFWRRFAFVPLPFMLDGLGDFWATQTLTVKTFPGCHYFQTACSAVEEIVRAEGPLDEARVRSVRVDTTKLGLEVTRFAAQYAAPDGVTPVNVNFDLATTLAILLHAGRLGPDEVQPAWLTEHAEAIRRWRARIQVRHDPALTARVVACAREVAGGRAALSQLGPAALLTLARRYRDEYRSTLVTPEELGGWLMLGARSLLGWRAPSDTPGLAFPNRVTVELADGRSASAEVDVPVGSFARPESLAALERKFLGVTRGLGERARAAWAGGLEAESLPLDELVGRFTYRAK